MNLETLIIEVLKNNELLISELNNIPYKNNQYSLEHLNYFNFDTLRKLLEMSFFKISYDTQYQKYRLENTFGWLKYGKGVSRLFYVI